MDEELYRLVSTGLLGLIVLLLILAIVKLGNLRRDRGEATAPSQPQPSPEPASAETSDDQPAEVEQEPRAQIEEEGATHGGDPEEAPFERDGRWWYRRDGELLVYDEQVEQWVDPNAADTSAAAAAPQSEPSATSPTPDPMGVSVYDSPQPDVELEQHPLDEAKGWDATPSTHAPIPEPVSPPEPITAEAEPDEEEQQSGEQNSGSHWKCPACGVINGSTATSCRMCFSARP